MTELKPCPFCGGIEVDTFHHPDRGGMIGESWHVECVGEQCGNRTCHHETKAEAIAAWNTRAAPRPDGDEPKDVALLEALKALDEIAVMHKIKCTTKKGLARAAENAARVVRNITGGKL